MYYNIIYVMYCKCKIFHRGGTHASVLVGLSTSFPVMNSLSLFIINECLSQESQDIHLAISWSVRMTSFVVDTMLPGYVILVFDIYDPI